jgi:hypothetical protein
MNSEQNVPEAQMHQGPPPPASQMEGQTDLKTSPQIDQNVPSQDSAHNVQHGMGQSKSSRRRRRKRKNKSQDAGQQGAQFGGQSGAGQFVGDLQAGDQGQVLASGGQQPQNFQAGAPQQAGAGPSTKRWKKKFRDRDRQRAPENPGNQASPVFINGNGSGYRDGNSHQPGNGGSFKRKGKQQRGPRSFVGPMDHSYRAVNGNFADAPPSTIEAQGNFLVRGGSSRGYVSDSQPIDYSIGRPIPVAEDAPTRIFFFIEDLFFNAKITETARKLGVKVAFIKNDKDAVAELTEGDEANRPGLIVFDLNNANAKPLTLIPKLKAKLKKSTSIVGFLSHLQGELRVKAVEAGCDTVMPRSAFSQNLPNLLRRYGIQDEEEDNFNQ